VFGLAIGATLVLAAPCLACSCVPSTPAVALRRADAAFIGRVVNGVMTDTGTTQTFEVDQVFKGELSSTVDVWAEVGTRVVNTCSVLYPAGDPVAVLLFEVDGRWTSQACSYVTPAELRDAGGPPREPIEAAPPSEEGGGAPGDIGSPPPGSAGPSPGVVIALGALLAVAVIGAQVVWTARRDRRETAPEDGAQDEPSEEAEA
jgi:hypothetical protein